MAVKIENIELVNALITLLEWINNLEGKETLAGDLAERARYKINSELDGYFPPPPP